MIVMQFIGSVVGCTLVDPEINPRNYPRNYLRNYLRTGNAKVIGKGREVLGLRKDQSQFPLFLTISEIPDSCPRRFVGVLRDNTKQKNHTDELRLLSSFPAPFTSAFQGS